jgi:general secretion pathway protein G
MTTVRNARRGFTLVEILIVVIILGILAAIVIPQFSNASNDARKSSLVSQLQTLRSQIQLYSLQHTDQLPPSLKNPTATPWAEMTVKTNADHTTTGTPVLGPYLQATPVNSLNGLSTVALATSDYGSGAGGLAAPSTVGWVFDNATGKIWATSKTGLNIYDETNPAAATNDQ